MFRTELIIAPATGQLARTARVLTMGSCFADSMGARLLANKVKARVNPFGTIFQPLALARLLRAAAGEDVDWQQHLVQARGRWQSYDLHGSVGADSPVELLQYIQEVVRQTGEFLRNADVVLLTLGTAWAYRLRETGELVNNCHKQPGDLFVRELLTPDEIINALAETHAYLRRINPGLRFVLTVSPVRHLKDTLQLNAVSKSVLRLATHIVSELLPGVAYFPAYELLVDDLRDYRFYASDMLHPSEVAEEYIWDKFARAYFDADFGRFRKDWAAVRQSLGHRPLHEGAPEHRQFLESTREKLEQLSLRKVDVTDELRTVRARLEALPLPAQPTPAAELEDDEERIDIGEGARSQATLLASVATEPETTQTERPADNSGRPPRLSPEEFRAQRAARPERGRRDGRGKGQAIQPSETEQFQTASFAQADEFTQQPFLTESMADDVVPVASAAETTIEGPEESSEAGRKKKRRSRGGAKRTARKHALRDAEMVLNEGQLPASEMALEAAAEHLGGDTDASAAPTQAENIPASEAREPRRDQRNDRGRGRTRDPLFAAAVPTDAAPEPAEASDTSAVSVEGLTELEGGPVSSSRKSRNRKKKKGNRPVTTEPADMGSDATPVPAPRGAVEAVVAPETLAAARDDNRRGNRDDNNRGDNRDNNRRDNRRPQEQAVAALPVAGAPGAVATTPVVFVSAPAGAQSADSGQTNASAMPKSSKRKSRAMVGGRAVKPDVDTPIIPVVDASVVRTQVAAGRLMGTSASLVEPTTPVKAGKAASQTKPAAIEARGAKAPVAKAAAATGNVTVASPPVAVIAAPPGAAPVVTKTQKPAIPATGSKQTQKTKATPVAAKAVATTVKAPKITATPATQPSKSADAAAAVPTQAATGKVAAKPRKAVKATTVATPQVTTIGNSAAVAKPAKTTKAEAKPAAKVKTPVASAPVVPAVSPAAKSAPKPLAKPAPTASLKGKAAAKPAPKAAKAAAEQASAKAASAKTAAPKAAPLKAAPKKKTPTKPAAAKPKAPKRSAS